MLSTSSRNDVLQACWPLTKTSARSLEAWFDRNGRVFTRKWMSSPFSLPEARMRPEGASTRPVIPAATLVFSQTGTRPWTQWIGTFVKLQDACGGPEPPLEGGGVHPGAHELSGVSRNCA